MAFKCFSKIRKQCPLVAGCSKGKYFSLFYYFKMKPGQIIFQMLSDRHPKGAIANASTVQNVLFREIWEREQQPPEGTSKCLKGDKNDCGLNCKD